MTREFVGIWAFHCFESQPLPGLPLRWYIGILVDVFLSSWLLPFLLSSIEYLVISSVFVVFSFKGYRIQFHILDT